MLYQLVLTVMIFMLNAVSFNIIEAAKLSLVCTTTGVSVSNSLVSTTVDTCNGAISLNGEF